MGKMQEKSPFHPPFSKGEPQGIPPFIKGGRGDLDETNERNEKNEIDNSRRRMTCRFKLKKQPF
jgi:hypothetical protein